MLINLNFIRSARLITAFFICFAMVNATAQTNGCDEGVIRLSDNNGTIQICSALAAKVPQLSKQLSDMAKLVGSQQLQMNELTRLVRGLNNVSRGIDTQRQAAMMQSLSAELSKGSQNDSVEALKLVNERLDNLQASLLGALSDPKMTAALGDALKGPLGDAIAKLDLNGASKQIEDIGERLKALQSSVSEVRTDTVAIRQQLDQIDQRQQIENTQRKGREEAAVDLLKKISGEIRELGQTGGLISNPRNFSAHYHNARILSQKGETDLAIASYRQVFKTGVQMADPVIDLTTLLIRQYGRQGASKAIEHEFQKELPKLSYLYALQILADGELNEVEELLFAKPELVSEFPPLATVYLRRLHERMAKLNREKLNVYSFQWSDTAGMSKVATTVNKEIQSGNYLAYFIDQIRGGRDLDDFRVVSDTFTHEKLLNVNVRHWGAEKYASLKINLLKSPIGLDYTYFFEPPSKEALSTIASSMSYIPRYKKSSVFLNIWDGAIDEEKSINVCAKKSGIEKCKDINDAAFRCAGRHAGPPINCSLVSDRIDDKYFSPVFKAHLVSDNYFESACLTSVSYTTRQGSAPGKEIRVEGQNLIAIFRRVFDDDIGLLFKKCGYDVQNKVDDSKKNAEQKTSLTSYASTRFPDRTVAYSKNNCEMLGRMTFYSSSIGAPLVYDKMNQYRIKIAREMNTLPEVPSYKANGSKGRFDEASNTCYFDLHMKDQDYSCKVDGIVASRWIAPNTEMKYLESNNKMVDISAVWNGGVFPNLNSPIKCEITNLNSDASAKRSSKNSVATIDKIELLEKFSIADALEVFGAGYNPICKTNGYSNFIYRISLDLGLRVLEKNICVSKVAIISAKLEAGKKSSEQQFKGCFTAEGMANYVKAAEVWLTNTATDCKGKDAKLAKQYAEQAATWSTERN